MTENFSPNHFTCSILAKMSMKFSVQTILHVQTWQKGAFFVNILVYCHIYAQILFRFRKIRISKFWIIRVK